MNITVGILTFNNEDTIERALSSISGKFKTIVADSGSTDSTEEICNTYQAEFIFNQFQSFADQRNFLIKKCKTEFIFFLDSDEALTPDLVSFLENDFDRESVKGSVFRVARTEYLDGKEIESGYGRSDYQSRLLRVKNVEYRGEVHETPFDCTGGTEVELPFNLRILHNPDRDFNSMMERLVSYSRLMSKKKIEQNRKVGVFMILFNLNWQFLRLLILSRKEGYRGVLAAWAEALARTITYLYVYAYNSKKAQG